MAALSRRACGLVLALAACSLLQPAGARSFASPSMGKDVKMNRIGKYESGVVDDGSMEIVAYDAETKTVAVVDASDEAPGITLLDVEDPTNPKMKSSISYKGGAAGQGVGNPNSVVFHKSMLIVGAAATTLTDNGFVTFFKLDGTKLGQVEACPLPDNVVVNDDGSKVYVACEGEPSDGDKGPLDNTNPNPAGAIGVVDVTYSSDGQFQKAELTKTISLQKYIDGLSDEAFNTLKDKGFMLDGRVPKDQAAVDMEPEYIALGGGRAYVSLQENNAIAVVDLETEEVTDIWPMGIKDWSGMMIDISGEDADGNDAINRQKWPYLWGLYQPDTIVYHTINGKGYLFTANEGDAKDNYEMEVSDLADDQFDLEHFSDPTNTKKDHQMGKLKINPFCGLKNGYDTSKGVKEQGPYSYLCSYGGRSFSIIDTETGKMVADSGDDLEDQVYKEAMMLKAKGAPFCFNCDNNENDPGRSDNKGCEPEAIEVFTENGRTFAIVGLERQSSIVVYEVTEPTTPVFVRYFNNRNYDSDLGKVTAAKAPHMGMLGPEMLKYVPASSSPNSKPMLISSGEVSGTLSVFEMEMSDTSLYGRNSFGSSELGQDVVMKRIGRYQSGVVDDGSMEIVAFDADTNTVAVVDASDAAPGITLLDVKDPTNPKKTRSISYKGGAAGQGVGNPNSVVFHKSMLIVGAAATDVTENGYVTFWNLDGDKLGQVEACPLPDNVVVNNDGSKVYVACEGEPSDDEESPLDDTITNPAGAIGVVDVTYSSDGQFQKAELTKTISLQKYIDGLSDEAFNTLKDKGFMLDGRVPKDQAAVDMEPEYIALGGGRAYVSLQENNAIAVVDLETEEVTDIWPMGIKDWSNMEIDISGKDADGNDAINRQKWTYLRSLYQPDTIVYHTINGKGYLFTANEGDAKDTYEMEISELADSQFDLDHFPDPDKTRAEHQMGKLAVHAFCGLKNGYDASKGVKEQGPYSYFCAYGGRSFSIIDTETGKMVADSGDDLEDRVYQEAMMLKDAGAPFCFNCDNNENDPNRSDNKGCEPEAIEVFTEEDRTFALVGLERQSSIVVYEVTDPESPVFVRYFNNRNYDPDLKLTAAEAPQMGMLGPEMLKYVPASSSPNGKPMLISSGEISGTLSVFQMELSQMNLPDGGPSPDEVPTSSNATIETTVTVDAELSEVNAQEFAEEMRSTYERNLKKLDSGIMETATVTAGTPKEGSIILPLTVTLDSQTSSADLQAFAEKINDAGTDTLFDGTNYKVTSLTFDNLDVDNAASSCVMNFVLAAVMLGFALLM